MLREGSRFTANKPHFADEAKFTARKFRFLQATGKFHPLQAALNFKISLPQNGHSY
ncbi:hypothetical protein [uncultured Campylobacter sp.]|uniref:hypothetical protein n=1 Tax=uncultured Campylobacter sp. TaxID=218934 RepID=UPI00262239D0|nr:hypothetical protein [uncultured Campylobacter sp.]